MRSIRTDAERLNRLPSIATQAILRHVRIREAMKEKIYSIASLAAAYVWLYDSHTDADALITIEIQYVCSFRHAAKR